MSAGWTKGECSIPKRYGKTLVCGPNERTICSTGGYSDNSRDSSDVLAENEANAVLIAEAFNVADETGLTPRQLADQRAELLTACNAYIEAFNAGTGVVYVADKIRAAIANAMIAESERTGK